LWDYLPRNLNVGDTLSAIITEDNDFVTTVNDTSPYAHVQECNLVTVQQQSLKLLPELAKWDIEALDTQVHEKIPRSKIPNTQKSK